MKTSDWIAVAAVIVAALGVLGTWAIAALALWGDWFRSQFPFLRPRLILEPVGLGDMVRQNNGLKARYYFLRVRNVRPGRLPAAHEAQVLITRVDREDAAGQPTPTFAETVPLAWVRGEIYPLLRTIGPDAESNFLWVREDGWFQFEPIVWPNHFPPGRIGRAKFWVTVQVRAIEADSEPRRFRIDWDGEWHDGAAEIAEHLRVTPDPLA
jgi:hypothetical protein